MKKKCPDCEKFFRPKMDFFSRRNNVNKEKQEYKCNHCEEVFFKKEVILKDI